MSQNESSPAAGKRAGLGNSDCWAAIDPRDSGSLPNKQARLSPLGHFLREIEAAPTSLSGSPFLYVIDGGEHERA
jgi:hypothetical protein